MTAWLLPALKLILPHAGTLIRSAAPVFSRKNAAVSQQIAELQSAATENAENTRELAAQLQSTVTAIEHAAVVAEASMRRLFVMSITALAISMVSLGVTLALALR